MKLKEKEPIIVIVIRNNIIYAACVKSLKKINIIKRKKVKSKIWFDFDLYKMRKELLILRLHYVLGGHGGHVSDNREQNGITVRQRRGTG